MLKHILGSFDYELLACRGCLATDVDLYHIIGCGLKDCYEGVVGLTISADDNYPQHLCRLCKEYMLKYHKFRRKCRISQNLLTEAVKNGKLLTTDFIRTIDRPFYNLDYSFICTETTFVNCKPADAEKVNCHKVAIQCSLSRNVRKHQTKEKYQEIDMLNTDQVKVEKDDEDFENDDYENPLEHNEVTNSVNEKYVEDHQDNNKADEAINLDIKEDVEDDFKDLFTTDESDSNEDKTLKENNLKDSHKPDESVKLVKNVKKSQMLQPLSHDELADYAEKYNFEVTFFTEDEQFRHMEEKKNKTLKQSRAYYCHECYKIFTCEETLATHLENNHDPRRGEFICKFCKSRFKRRSILKVHLRQHSLKYTCKECGHVTTNRHYMKRHHEEHSGKIYMCNLCSKGFLKNTSYLNHVRLHHTSESWCDLCGESFVGSRGVHYHKRRVHRNVKDLEFKCEQCNKAFMYEAALEKHEDLEQCDLPACVHCGDSFANVMLLKYHLIQHKENDEVPQGLECGNCHVKFINEAARIRHEADCGDGKLPCLQCGQNFDTGKQLDEHNKLHEDDIFKCELCGQSYQNAYYYKIHYNTTHLKKMKRCVARKPVKKCKYRTDHPLYKRRTRVTTDEKLVEYVATLDFDVRFLTIKEQLDEIEEQKRNVVPYAMKCDLCGKNLRSQLSLKAHHLMHHDVSLGNNVCDICHMRYKTKFQLKNHLKTHRTSYSCKKCEFVTKVRDKAREHYDFHQGTKFVCQHCGKEFINIGSYMGHLRLQHADNSSWCELCGESFLGNMGINHHKLRKHKNVEDPEYVCINCNKAFYFKSALEKHESFKRCDWSSCVKCGESFVDPQLLRYHLIQQHSVDSAPQALKCGNCKVTFLNRVALRHHAGECGDGQWPCVLCGDNFNAEKELSVHVREQHGNSKKFKCEECNTTYANAYYYREHYKLHLQRIRRGIDDQHSANRVTSRKRRSVAIKTTSDVKVQKKNHVCPYCKKVFISSMHLEQHVKNNHSKYNNFSEISKAHPLSKQIGRNIKVLGQTGAEDGLIEYMANMNEVQDTYIEEERVMRDDTEVRSEQEEIEQETETKKDEEEMEVEELNFDELYDDDIIGVDHNVEEADSVQCDDNVSYIEFYEDSISED